LLQQDDIKVSTRPDPERSVIEFTGPPLGEVDQIAEGAHGERWMYHQRLRADAEGL
jgi:hypothetical protein